MTRRILEDLAFVAGWLLLVIAVKYLTQGIEPWRLPE
jgi:hypothetical protein